MKRLLAVPIVLVAIVACTGPTILSGCEAYSSALKTLAVARAQGDLTVTQEASVDRWRPILNDICLAGTPPEGSAAFSTLETGLIALAQIQAGS